MSTRVKLRPWQWIAIILLLAFVVDWFIQRPDSRTRTLNDAIAEQGSRELKAYPYPFHVLRVEGDTAVMGTPRSFQVPVGKFISAFRPGVNVLNTNDPAFIAAQKELASVQSEARAIVLRQPGIKSVSWEIDKRWLTSHGIEVPDEGM